MAFFKSRLLKHVRQTLDLVYPVRCIKCGCPVDTSTNNGVYCQTCRTPPVWDPPSVCPFCHALLPDRRLIAVNGCYCCLGDGKPLSGIVTLGRYHEDDELGQMILAMKHGGKTWYSREFGTQLATLIRHRLPDAQWDAIVSVPLHVSRYWKRGYNQAGLIARFLGESLDVGNYDWLLKRVRKTRPQSGGRLVRQQNVSNAFATGGICQNADIILVDDVVTTGATIRESARALFMAGARSVLVAACAWVPMGHPDRSKSSG